MRNFLLILILFALVGCVDTQQKEQTGPWNEKYDFVYELPPIVYHYDHGMLAGSYPPGVETTEVSFNDVCNYMGHVCLCGAGGYKIAEKAVNALSDPGENLEKGDFVFISSRDHSVSDVIAFVLGVSKRDNPEKNQYFVDTDIEAPKREYHYYIAFPAKEKAVHVIYRKHLLIGNEEMDKLWKVELAFEDDPDSVSKSDKELYSNIMHQMVSDVLLDGKNNLIEVEPIEYTEFTTRLESLKSKYEK